MIIGSASKVGVHSLKDAALKGTVVTYHEDTAFTYSFQNFFHPYVGELIEKLNRESLAGLLDPNYHASLTKDFFTDYYSAPASDTVKFTAFPKKQIDLADDGPYACYNWELLFHVPLTVAVHLSKNQRFAEAQRWFHYIFDPTCTDESIDPPRRFWKFLRFRQDTDVQQIDDLLALLSKPEGECSDPEAALRKTILSGYQAILAKPFQPHAVARTRTTAYQYCVVMKYLDNLIAWGDSLFAQDTVESINEATQVYVLAANLLGDRPQRIPPRRTVRPKTFAQLQGLDVMGNALVELEGAFPFNVASPPPTNGAPTDSSGPLFGIGRTLYFCIPRNDKLLAYWDTVADRLFKIRHCMNIAGVVRQLALFDPPLDPGMLVKAGAAGIDVGSIIAGLNQPLGPVRSPLLIQKALELCSEVRGLGSALLSALEKRDSEHLGLLRQGHEIKIQQMSQEVRFLQWKQAQEATQSLLRTRASALDRYRYYLRLLGLTPDADAAPETFPLDRSPLTEENFDETYAALVDRYDKTIARQQYPALKLAQESPANQSGAGGAGKLYLNANENADLNIHSRNAKTYQAAAWGLRHATPVLGLVPQFPIDIHYWGLGGTIEFGGEQLSKVAVFAAELLDMLATMASQDAASASKTASFERRADDWMFQSNLAARELMQIGRQIISSLIAEQIAHHEYLNIQQQIENAQEVDQFLNEKFTSEELYAWMQGETSRLYYEYYRLAVDTARKVERTMKQELMRPELDATSFVQFNYWDGGRKGFLSGENLYLDVKRMELAYHENNKREYELTRHISLRQLDPLALLSLKVTGKCEFSIPESVYELDCAGHYMRRIKSVAVSTPSVVGPYTSLNCTVSLLRSKVRKSPLLDDDGVWGEKENDDRFVQYYGSVQSVVTSTGSNDSGLFETNLRDDRFLPFEGAGAISTWRLELPKGFRAFDYSTIADVILHVRYTARPAGDPLRDEALIELRATLEDANAAGLALLFSLRHDFPTEWAAFATGNGDFAVRLRENHFPYMVQSETLAMDSLELYAANGDKLVKRSVGTGILADDLNGSNRYSDLTIPPDATVLKRDAAQVFLIIRYHLEGV